MKIILNKFDKFYLTIINRQFYIKVLDKMGSTPPLVILPAREAVLRADKSGRTK
jgi:hypothetical protein